MSMKPLTACSGDDMVLHSSRRSSGSSWPWSVQPTTLSIGRGAIPVNSCATGVVITLRATFFDGSSWRRHAILNVRVIFTCPRCWTTYSNIVFFIQSTCRNHGGVCAMFLWRKMFWGVNKIVLFWGIHCANITAVRKIPLFSSSLGLFRIRLSTNSQSDTTSLRQ